VLFDSGQVVPFKIDGTSPKAEHGLRVKTPSGAVAYDKVLVDAPCSSERHIIHSHAKAVASGRIAEEMATWRPGSSKRLAKTQIDLLMTGLKVVKINGTVVYATCSIEPTENDDVVEKVVAQVEKERKKGATWSIKVGLNAGEGNQDLENELERTWAERTKYGWIALPDHPSGGKWGPLFFTMITKVKG
jgi:16S rRNA C967 or C1407 C5-methylase (RsmB/RsmF family)